MRTSASSIMVTGKGGVGKTTLSAALGFAQSSLGHKTLVLEFDVRESLHAAFEVEPSDGEFIEIQPGLDLCYLRPERVAMRWIEERTNRSSTVSRLMKSDLLQMVVGGAPGLRELAVLRTLMQSVKPNGPYDRVVLDAPAGGHGLSWVEAPRQLLTVLPDGPIKEEVESIASAMHNPSQFGLWLITIPTAMAVEECLEFKTLLTHKLQLSPEQIVLNQTPPNVPSTTHEQLPQAFEAWRRNQQQKIDRLKEKVRSINPEAFHEVQHSIQPFGLNRVKAVAETLSSAGIVS